MAGNNFLSFIFSSGSEMDPEHRFDLSRRARTRRLREISAIARKHHFFRGISPVAFREMLEDLGPSFVKIGQTLASRSEILPQAYCDELVKLQMECDPQPFEEVKAALVAEYGQERYDQIFADVDPTPLGSASLAQVHKARLTSGEIVAVKVQRPGVKVKMALDIAIMRQFARRATKMMRREQMVDLEEVVEELWQTFLEETDFEREAENLQEFARTNAAVKYVRCPAVFREYCTEYVLVMEYIDGIGIGSRQKLIDAGYDLHEIGEKLLDNYATQILDHGFFHADPHAGNIIISGGQIVYIDLGIMGRLSLRDRNAFGRIIDAVGAMDASRLKDALMSFAIVKDNEALDHARFLADLDLLLSDYASLDIADLDVGVFLADVFTLTRQSHVTLPTSITSVSRGIVTLEGTVAPFVSQDNIFGIITTHIRHSEDSVDKIQESLADAARSLVNAARGLTEAAASSGQVMRMMTRGQLKVNMNMTASPRPMRVVTEMITRMTMAIIIAGLFIGSSMLPQGEGAAMILGVPWLSFFGYLGAFILSIYVVIGIFRR